MTTVNDPFPIDPTTVVVNKALDGLVGILVKAIEADVAALAPPFTANPVVMVIDNEIIQLIANALYKKFALVVDFAIIDYKVDGQEKDFKAALAALKLAQGKGDQNAIQLALTELGKNVGALTVLNGAAKP